MRRFLIFLLILCSTSALAQRRLRMSMDHQCIFSGGVMDSIIYMFEASEKVPEWVDEILEVTGQPKNFELIDASVENVTALVEGDRRVVLYSVDFVINKSALEVYAALAHEVGHHVHRHLLRPGQRMKEESEADVFMGFFLAKKGFKITDLETGLFRSMPSSYGKANRRSAALEGFRKGENAMFAKSLAFEHDPRAQNLLLPSFNFDKCYTTCEIPNHTFAGRATLAKVDEKIRLVLDTRGYYNRSYFSVRNGFAVVAQMEQYNRNDATVRNDRTRWLDYPVKDNFAGMIDAISSVFVAQKGYFRIFVLVVTDSAFTSSGKQISKQEAAAWLNQGANRLPDDIGRLPFTSGYTVSALVYEFEVPQTTHNPRQVCPAPLYDARTHLIRSGLGAGFGIK